MGENENLQLNFIHETIWKERTNRSIHHSHRENFLLARWSFFLAETAWILARGWSFFTVIAGQWEEIDACARIGADGGREDHSFSISCEDCSAGELGNLASFKSEDSSSDFFFYADVWFCCHDYAFLNEVIKVA